MLYSKRRRRTYFGNTNILLYPIGYIEWMSMFLFFDLPGARYLIERTKQEFIQDIRFDQKESFFLIHAFTLSLFYLIPIHSSRSSLSHSLPMLEWISLVRMNFYSSSIYRKLFGFFFFCVCMLTLYKIPYCNYTHRFLVSLSPFLAYNWLWQDEQWPNTKLICSLNVSGCPCQFDYSTIWLFLAIFKQKFTFCSNASKADFLNLPFWRMCMKRVVHKVTLIRFTGGFSWKWTP